MAKPKTLMLERGEKGKKMTPLTKFWILLRLVKFFFIRWLPLAAVFAAVCLLFVFVNPKRVTKKFWIHIGGHKTATTTLQRDIFPHHPEICFLSIPSRWFLNQLRYADLVKVPDVILAIYLRLYFELLLWTRKIFQITRKTWFSLRVKTDYDAFPIITTLQVTPPATISDPRNKVFLLSSENLSILLYGSGTPEANALPQLLRANTGILYVTRNEETHLQSMWLAYLTGVITKRADDLPYTSADDFARLARAGGGSGITSFALGAVVLETAFCNVYNPKRVLQETSSRWGTETVVLPYELLQKDPEVFLGKMSRAMGISADITISLFKKSIRKKGMKDFGHHLNPEFSGRRNVSMTERGLAFCRAFKHPRAEYNEDRQFFFKTARNYAENLPGRVNERFLACLANIEKGWSGDSALAIAKLAEDKPFQDWVRKGDRVKPQFSAKTLAELRRIRAPQNRWMAKKFNLDLAKYGYAMRMLRARRNYP